MIGDAMNETKNTATCPFNEGVVCTVQLFCDRCGWNPKVAEERTERILKQLKKRRKSR